MTMLTAKPTLSIDLDDVISDTRSLFLKEGKERGYEFIDTNLYHPRHWFKVSPEQSSSLIDFCNDILHEASPVSLSLESVRCLKEYYDLVVVTGRSRDRHWLSTDVFLDCYFKGLFDEVVFCDYEGSAKPKSEILRGLEAAAHVEDLPDYVLEVASSGVPVVYLNRRLPWQFEIDHPLVTTARHWNDVPAALELAGCLAYA